MTWPTREGVELVSICGEHLGARGESHGMGGLQRAGTRVTLHRDTTPPSDGRLALGDARPSRSGLSRLARIGGLAARSHESSGRGGEHRRAMSIDLRIANFDRRPRNSTPTACAHGVASNDSE